MNRLPVVSGAYWGVLLAAVLSVAPNHGAAQQDEVPPDFTAPDYPTFDEPSTPPTSAPTLAPRRPQRLTSGFGVDAESEGAAGGGEPAASPKVIPTSPPTATSIATALASPTAGPSPTPLPPLSKAVENLRWEASLAENSYGIDKSEGATLALIVAYERVLGPLCMPELHRTLSYKGPPTDPRCLEYIEKIVAIDPANPLVLCARDGIDARSCRSAFAAQQIEAFIPGRTTTAMSTTAPKPTDSLNEQLAVSTVESKIQPILSRIKSIEYQIRPNTPLSEENRETLVKSYREGLNLTCRISRLERRGAGSTQPTLGRNPTHPTVSATPTQPPLFPGLDAGKKRKSAFDEVLEQFGGASPTPPAALANDPRIRIRKITDTCRDFINRALKFDRTMSLPICYREGFYSPACIDARRKEQNNSSSESGSGSAAKPATAEGSASGGFSTF